MFWINLTIRRGTFTKDVQHAVMAKLTDALMFWEKIPDTPEARKKMMGWVYEVAEDSGYSAGSPHHEDPFYGIEVRLLAGRFDRLTKQHLTLDFTKTIMLAEGKTHFSEDATRVWVTIVELQTEDWSIGGDAKASMLQDFERARTTEIDFINGYVVDTARQFGLNTPVNTAIVETVCAITRGQSAPDPII